MRLMLRWLIQTLVGIFCGLLSAVIVIAGIYAWSAFAPGAPDPTTIETLITVALYGLPVLFLIGTQIRFLRSRSR